MKIVFICTGNTCRSPMAEGFMKKYAEEYKLNVEISSRALMLNFGETISPNSISAMKVYNIDISGHIPKTITLSDIESADIILTMTSSHAEILKNVTPQFFDKIITLAEYTDTDEIVDPYGCDFDVYCNCASEIRKSVIALCDKLKNNELE